MKLTIPTAKVFIPLCEPARYKGAYGGRGSAKSYCFAENLIDRSMDKGTLSVCIREVQKSLKDSAKRLIESRLNHYGLSERHGFKVFRDVIETPGDGVILFQGMQDHTSESIKSLEGFHIAWVEEAQTLSRRSLQMLRPTIRWEDKNTGEYSELWFSWNPRFRTDPVDEMLRGKKKPTDSIVVKSTWQDNPWFPSILEQERIDCLNNEPDYYEHIWQGDYVGIAKGAYYAKQIATAKDEDRFCHVAVDQILPIKLFVDIGGTGAKSDAFAIWAAQFVGAEIRVVNYYEAQGQDIATHLAWMQSQDYTSKNATIYLPHDGATNDRVYDVSYESAFKQADYEVTVIPNQGKGAALNRIQETRRLFPSIFIDKEKCKAGIESLSWYHERIDEVRGIGLGPEHDFSSHAADAFGLMCVVHQLPGPKSKPIKFDGWN